MRTLILLPLSFFVLFLLAALSTGSPVLLLVAVLLAILLISGFLSVRWVAGTLQLSGTMETRTVQRGETVRLRLKVRHSGYLPVAPLRLEISDDSARGTREIYLRDVPGKQQELVLPFQAKHVGACFVGIRSWTVEDLLGFFRIRKAVDQTDFRLLVLPNLFRTEPLTLSPGDPGTELLSRATEDLTSPSDIRAYQQGDPLKKIHWKLSLRKREPLVRKFEEPVLQEVLILMDCSEPPSWGHPEAEADLKDAMIETAASVFVDQEQTDLKVHLPLFGSHPVELENSMGMTLALENLALVDFSEPDRFERVLTMESRRLRKVGCLVVIAARLNSAMVDVMTRMRQMGPALRLYLVTFSPDDQNLMPLISRLQISGIEVSYVRPAAEAA